MIFGYARTSTADQLAGLDAQVRDLTAAGAERMFSEHISALAVIRPQFKECMDQLCPGDVLMVTKPDRLARSTAHLLTIVDDLNARGVGLILLSMGGQRFDTRNPTSKLMLTLLAAVAEFERNIMRERQKEGIAKAKAEGKYKGRKPKFDHAELRRLAAEMGPQEAIRTIGIAPSWGYNILSKAA